jgi:hypothetical protein
MTPKEKAKELYLKVWRVTPQPFNIIENSGLQFNEWDKDWTDKLAKECAKIAVNEIIEALEEYDERTENYLKKDFPNYFSSELQNMEQDLRYWQEVKEEIEKL